jgi:hypothetical protein
LVNNGFYAQGMSDLLSPLFFVLKDESLAYFCFCSLMKRCASNFDINSDSICSKIELLTFLLNKYDPVFWQYLKEQGAEQLLFVYRWLLIDCKREFPFNDSLRMFEIMWSTIETTSLISSTSTSNNNNNNNNNNKQRNYSPPPVKHLSNKSSSKSFNKINSNQNNNNNNQMNVSYSPTLTAGTGNNVTVDKTYTSAYTSNYLTESQNNSNSKLTDYYNKNYANNTTTNYNTTQNTTTNGPEKSSSNSMTAVSNNRSSYKMNAPTSLIMTESHMPAGGYSINTSSLANRKYNPLANKSTGSSTNVSSVDDSPRGSSASKNFQNSNSPTNEFIYKYNNNFNNNNNNNNHYYNRSMSPDNSSALSKKTSPPSSVTKSSYPNSATINNSISTIKTSYPTSYNTNTTNNQSNYGYQAYKNVYNDYFDD